MLVFLASSSHFPPFSFIVQTVWDTAIGISKEAQENWLAGKHAIFFVFKSDTKEKSLCTLLDFVFTFAE